MHRLGYTRYVAQGGDVGAAVTDAMGRQAPDGLLGIHLNLLLAGLGGGYPSADPSAEERAALDAIATFRTSGNGYLIEQNTRPQTIGYALLDSPVALAAWMLDHDTDSYYKISRAFLDGQPSGGLTRDQIVDNITLYWLTGTGASAARSYWENAQAAGPRGGEASSGGQAPGRLHHVPRRDLPGPAQLGREVLPQRHLLPRGRQGRPLRRLGRTRAVRDRDPGGVRPAALTNGSPHPGLTVTTRPRCACQQSGRRRESQPRRCCTTPGAPGVRR